ncbi:hypothetical protein NDU88_007863 [Pleurodeles waltl]|uniref:Uncharacterized protein n=1 Tax=Pleurodeles waltl TaxID=8319 RepID=A0AAV7U3L3_PLEWA|nr:hypothetical protein NDU88_007863 [Pleurodeles waltl]
MCHRSKQAHRRAGTTRPSGRRAIHKLFSWPEVVIGARGVQLRREPGGQEYTVQLQEACPQAVFVPGGANWCQRVPAARGAGGPELRGPLAPGPPTSSHRARSHSLVPEGSRCAGSRRARTTRPSGTSGTTATHKLPLCQEPLVGSGGVTLRGKPEGQDYAAQWHQWKKGHSQAVFVAGGAHRCQRGPMAREAPRCMPGPRAGRSAPLRAWTGGGLDPLF